MDDAPLLLTPGPLTTAPATRRAMLRDWGSRDPAFTAMVRRVRPRLSAMVGPDVEAIPMQGSGTFAVEAMIGTLVPPSGELLVLVNGAYGRRMVELAQRMGRRVSRLEWPEHAPCDAHDLDRVLTDRPGITHVAVVYCETTTGMRNPIEAIADAVKMRGRRLLIDAMSAFGAMPLLGQEVRFDAVAASANKCLEGVPGLGFVLVREGVIDTCANHAPSVSLDLHSQWARLRRDGQFRFTPPTHVIAALDRALDLHADEGGVPGRYARYAANCRVLVDGLRELGFRTLLPDHQQAPIIVTVLDPASPGWRFQAVYEALAERGFMIYPGKLTERATFRVGCIGDVRPSDMRRFLDALTEVMAELGVASGDPTGREAA